MRIDREEWAIYLACLPAALAVAFGLLAPSDGANVGAGLLLVASIPIGYLIYATVRGPSGEG